MGLLSGIFKGGKSNTGIISGRNPGKGWIDANKFNRAKGGFAGGYGAYTFRNIIDAHSSSDDIVEEFGLDREDAPYGNCYQRAYKEEYRNAIVEMMLAMDFFGDPEDYIDWDAVEEAAYDYAIELAERWINGDEWIPEEVIEWAYYDVSGHNW